jgi:environmental stress-induced protein Ves
MDAPAVKLTHLTPADYKVMPWKNGGGTTTELMVKPAGTAANYDWRISIAEVAQSGPFSDFEGYQRTIMLLEGAGFTLHFARKSGESPQPQSKKLEFPFEPFRFAGEWQTDCTLIDGPIRDFNLIASRTGPRAELEVVRPTLGLRTFAAPVTVLYCLDGQVSAFGKRLGKGETLRIDDGESTMLLDGRSIVAVIRIGGPA